MTCSILSRFKGLFSRTSSRRLLLSIGLLSGGFVLGAGVFLVIRVMGVTSGSSLGPQYVAGSSYLDPAYRFDGNLTSIQGRPMDPAAIGVFIPHAVLMRQADCSVTGYVLTGYSMISAMMSSISGPSLTHYEQHLHTLAGLTTTPNVFAKGCQDRTLGGNGAEMVVLGKTAAGKVITVFFDENNNLYTAVVDPAGSYNATQTGMANIFELYVADLNGDGINDVIYYGLVSGAGYAGTLISHGDGTYDAPVQFAAGGITDLVVDDFTGDGKPDVAVNHYSGPIQVYPGKGDGTFGSVITGVTPTPQVSGYDASGDFNGDGKRDILLGGGQMLLGNGDGTFTAAGASGASGVGSTVADFNNDGKDDVAFSDSLGVQIFLGDGTGKFTAGQKYASTYGSEPITSTDIDGDGNIDLIVGDGSNGLYKGRGLTDGIFTILMGRGDGTFVGARDYASVVSTATNGSFALGDFNNDKNLDVLGLTNSVFSVGTGITFLAGDGKGSLTAHAANTTLRATEIFAGDLNGDKNPDAITLLVDPNTSLLTLSVLNGKGDGTFASPVAYPVTTNTTSTGAIDVAIADLRGTGKPDVLVSAGDLIYVLRNNGDGTLGTATVVSDLTSTQSQIVQILASDVNGDGRPDLIASTGNLTSSPTLIFLTRTDGTFSAPVAYTPGGTSSTASFLPQYGTSAVADINKDGKPDLLIDYTDQTSGNNMLAAMLGKGDGTFGAAILSPLSGFAVGTMNVADADGDGNPDVLMTGCCGRTYTTLALGHGDGTFGTNYALAVGPQSNMAVFGDLNNDGHPDILISSNAQLITSLSRYTNAATPAGSTTTLSVSPSPATVGQAVTLTAQVTGTGGTPTGTVTFTNGTATLGTGTLDSTGKTTFSTSSLAAGTYSVTATYGGDGSFAASTSTVASLVVNAPLATSTTLLVSANPVTVGTSVTFTAIVALGGQPGVATGTVTFADGTTTLAAPALDATSRATLTTATLAVGAHTIKASYSGSATLAASSSSIVFTVNPIIAADFTLVLSAASSTVTRGSAATTTITVAPVGGYKTATALACSGAPANSTCAIAPASVTPDGTNPVTATVTIQTNVQSAAISSSGRAISFAVILPLGMSGGLALFGLRGRRKIWLQMLAAALLATLGAIAGCGHANSTVATTTTTTSPVTATGTYPITVTGSGGGTNHTATFTVTVQ